MLHREGRVGLPEDGTGPHHHERSRPAQRDWARPIFVIVAVAVLIYGAVTGMHWMISEFPWAR